MVFKDVSAADAALALTGHPYSGCSVTVWQDVDLWEESGIEARKYHICLRQQKLPIRFVRRLHRCINLVLRRWYPPRGKPVLRKKPVRTRRARRHGKQTLHWRRFEVQGHHCKRPTKELATKRPLRRSVNRCRLHHCMNGKQHQSPALTGGHHEVLRQRCTGRRGLRLAAVPAGPM